MFAYDLLHWSSFFGAAILLVLSPGPDHIFVLSTALKQGRRAGYAALAGIVTGLMMHTGAVAFGLAALIAASPEAFQALKLLGGLYLVYLGIKALRSMGIDLSEMAQPPQHVRKTYVQGLGINILNPKIAIFFLAFLPQFVVIDSGPAWAQLSVHALIIVAMGAMFQIMLVETAARLTPYLRARPWLPKWIDRGFGGVMIALGGKLALG